MYSRNFQNPPEAIVQKGKANFGTYNNISPRIDIKGMRAPYAGLPLPVFISNLRIKSRLDYVFETKNFIGFTEFFDFKIILLRRTIIISHYRSLKIFENINTDNIAFLFLIAIKFRKKSTTRINYHF